MEQFNKGTDHALVSQRFSLIKRLGPEPHRRRLRECFLRRGCLRLPNDFYHRRPQSRPLRPLSLIHI